jgi:uncharacterized membrane protein
MVLTAKKQTPSPLTKHYEIEKRTKYMFIELSLQIVIPSLILITFWVMPTLMPADLAFGVRIPPDHQEDSLINKVRRDFRAGIAMIALVLIIVNIFLLQTFPSLLLSTGTIFATLILASLNYYIAHYRLTVVKKREDWFAGQRQAIAVDTELHNEPIRLPIFWLVLNIVLAVAMFVTGALRYPSLPDRIATHFDANGVPNGWMDKSIGTFLIPLIALVLTSMFIILARFRPRPQAQLDPANIEASRTRYRKLNNIWGVSLLLISVLTNLLMFIVSLAIWQLLPGASQMIFIGIVVPVFPILIILIVILLYYRQLSGQSQRINRTSAQTPFVARDDDRYWKGGIFYFNPEDPSIFVEKRFGIGWTINFGHPVGMIFTVVVLVIVVGSLALTILVK